jgi:hypothetical protein
LGTGGHEGRTEEDVSAELWTLRYLTEADRDGTAVIDDAVAIIVEPVAGVDRVRITGNRIAHGVASIVADPVTVAGADAAAHRARISASSVLVDLAVAVVVEVVAALGGSLFIGQADRPLPCAGHVAARANARLPGVACVPNTSNAVVYVTVAIVIEQIADLGSGQHLPDALAVVAADALSHPDAAFTHPLGSGRTVVAWFLERTAGSAVIDQAVAVVVDAVAELGCRRSGDGVTARGVAGFGAHQRARTRAGASPGRAGLAEAHKLLIDLAVAIVVKAVAEFVERCTRPRATGHPAVVGAHPQAVGLAEPLPQRARFAEAQLLVDFAVAVVVDAVAPLGSWEPRLRAAGGGTIGRADRRTGLSASANADLTRRIDRKVLVYFAIAVVVKTVAGLDGAGAGAPGAVFTTLHALWASRLNASTFLTLFARRRRIVLTGVGCRSVCQSGVVDAEVHALCVVGCVTGVGGVLDSAVGYDLPGIVGARGADSVDDPSCVLSADRSIDPIATVRRYTGVRSTAGSIRTTRSGGDRDKAPQEANETPVAPHRIRPRR